MGWVIQRKKSCRQLLQFFVGFSHAAAYHRMPGHGKCHTFIFAQFEIALGVNPPVLGEFERQRVDEVMKSIPNIEEDIPF